jgi:flagellar motor switch protein FliM
MADLAIPIRARWNGLQITTGDLCNLRKDDIILLDSAISSRTAVFLGTIHKFFGQIGSKGDTLAVRLSAKIQG